MPAYIRIPDIDGERIGGFTSQDQSMLRRSGMSQNGVIQLAAGKSIVDKKDLIVLANIVSVALQHK